MTRRLTDGPAGSFSGPLDAPGRLSRLPGSLTTARAMADGIAGNRRRCR